MNLPTLPPELQAMAQDYAKVKLEAKMLRGALSASEQQYAHLYLYLLAVLRLMDGYTIRFKSEDLEAYSVFKDAWQLETFYEEFEGVGYQVLRLKEKGRDQHGNDDGETHPSNGKAGGEAA